MRATYRRNKKMTNCFSRRALTCALFLSTTALASSAYAQFAQSPTFRQIDDNGVDLVQGDLITSLTEGSIGSGAAALPLNRRFGNLQGIKSGGTTQWDRIVLQYLPGNGTFVEFGGRNDKFPGAEVRGATLTGSGGSYQYTAPDGTVVAFTNNEPPDTGLGDTSNLCRTGSTVNCFLVPTSITTPNGNVTTLEYGFWTHCFAQTPAGQPQSPDDPVHCDFVPRLKKVTNSFGYAIAFTYANTQTGGGGNPPLNWYQRTIAQLFNNAVSTTVPQASVSYAYPSTGVTDVTDIGGRVWRITDNSTTLAIRRPGAAANSTTYSLSSGKVTSVTKEGVTTTYSRVVGSTITMTVTDALAKQTIVTSSATTGRPTSVKDPLNRTTSFIYDASNRLQRVTLPEGNYVQYGYDTRGNVTSTTQVAKSGSGLPDIVTSATFPATCTNVKTCNQPATTTDARGTVTDYTYDSAHGGALTVTAPAPTTGAVRPTTTYSYAQFSGVYLPTGTSACQTLASCTNGADEARVTLGYDARGNATSITGRNGTGTLSVTSTATYDGMGNMLTVDGPLAGTADTTRYRYNTARDVIGTVGPDPDGAGTLKHRAVRNTYTNGLMTRQELGTVNSQSDPDWAAFAPAETVDITYDANARGTTQKLSGSGGAVALTQFSYDALGRSDCVATRMNPAIYASLPASACSLGTAGSNGPDRIGQTIYDFAGQVTQNKVAVGIADAATERTLTYTSNGELATLKDAESNLTTYEYDGHDRLVKTRLPNPTKGSGTSSTTDYEQLTYENTASGTRTSGTVSTFRNRANETITFIYDNLARVTLADFPNSVPGEGDYSYNYDLLGRLTVAGNTFSNHQTNFTYDALGRVLTQTNNWYGTKTSAWDAAGRRTRLTHRDGFFVDYDYLVTGEVTKIRENGATSGIGVLATFGYDNLGRRTSLTFGNGTSTSYAYDPVSRLTTLTNDLAGTANDLTIGSIAYNPASQIVSQNRSNDLYAWTGHGSGSTASVANGLNQLTSIGGAATTHDSKG
ncbi:MAG TPA: hypothetical protein VKM72_00980, partial [Thermoanaerobaculia bacterium]|nr:hypothetical protein [Thermoanaerobaculia bacterium]